MIIKVVSVALFFTLGFSDPLKSEGSEISGDWEVVTTDFNKFYGTISVSPPNKRIVKYAFVYNSQRVNTNDNRLEKLEYIGENCYSFGTKGDFFDVENTRGDFEVMLCVRGKNLFWTLLNEAGSVDLLPNWAVFKRSTDNNK